MNIDSIIKKTGFSKRSNYKSSLIKKTRRQREFIIAFLFLAPWLIGIFVFTLWPFINSFITSLHQSNLFSSTFIGLDNYKELLGDWKFEKSFIVTIKFVLIAVPLRLAFALFIAVILNNKLRGTNFFRSAMYLPSLIGGSVAIAAMWTQLFGPRGVVNHVLALFGIEGTSWIANPGTALYVLIILGVWQFGSSMVIFLAGLRNIPGSLYEACEIDGGSKIQSFIHITLPMLSPIILFNVVLQTINSFQTFTPAFIITKGGPLNETLFMVLYIYDKAFMSSEMGYASAMSWVLLLVILAVTGVLFFTSKYWVYYESE